MYYPLSPPFIIYFLYINAKKYPRHQVMESTWPIFRWPSAALAGIRREVLPPYVCHYAPPSFLLVVPRTCIHITPSSTLFNGVT